MAADARAVVITGASTGIGRAAAEHLDSLGWRVFAGVRSDEAASEIRSAGSERLTPLRLDVTDPAAIEAAVAEVSAALGARGLAGLVNNAGVGIGGPVELVPVDGLRRALEVNLVGPVAMIKAFLPLLRQARGRIVNVTSIGGRVATAFFGPYNASKFGLEAIGDSLRQELRPWGVDVIAIEPGSTATRIWDSGISISEELMTQAPEEQTKLYEEQLETMREAAKDGEKRARPPETVARAIAKALTRRRPRTRYVVGPDAHGQLLLSRLLPDRVFDRAVRRFIGLRD
jgi:NAD(P)-dependent dehydrogenase (short-subunit alcohol dehydrogenase family)